LGPFGYDEKLPGDDVINRGYQTRTSECFGYNTDNSKWYIWRDRSLQEDINGATQVAIPNSKMFGYDNYLVGNSYMYDGVLSISPVGTFNR
jgi:hypothetical protein